MVWRCGSALVSINEVNLRRARIVMRWVTALGSIPGAGHISRYVTSHPGQLSLAISSWVLGRRNEYQPKDGDALRLGSKGRWFVCGWQVKLCDPLVTHESYLSTLRLWYTTIKLYINTRFTYLLYFTLGLETFFGTSRLGLEG